MSYIDPDRHLNPPEPKAMPEREWEADFKCRIGDEGVLVNVLCDVTVNDEIDFESISVCVPVLGERDITDLLNSEHRKQIVSYFENNFEDIKRDCY
jgi:hypothetical protein